MGAAFYYSPVKFFRFFFEVPDDWLKAIEEDAFIAPLYFLLRGFSAMIFASGLSMILPLYDPLKYRGLIYYVGIIFPLISFPILLFHGIKYEHVVLTYIGIILLIILAANACALIITRKEAKAGIE